MTEFTKKSGMTFAKKGHIEHLKFAGTEINQHFRQNIGHFVVADIYTIMNIAAQLMQKRSTIPI